MMVIYFMFKRKACTIQSNTQCTGSLSPVYLVYLQPLHAFSYLLKKTVSLLGKEAFLILAHLLGQVITTSHLFEWLPTW